MEAGDCARGDEVAHHSKFESPRAKDEDAIFNDIFANDPCKGASASDGGDETWGNASVASGLRCAAMFSYSLLGNRAFL